MTHYIYSAALDWLGRGYGCLPILPGTKYIHKGFTLDNALTDQSALVDWFRDDLTPYNLAVVCPPGSFVLDFDDWTLYQEWIRFVKSAEDCITTSYTELTPSGGVHVFLRGEVPTNAKFRSGVEVKRHCLVAPSSIKGADFDYEPLGFGDVDIYSGSLDVCFFFLSLIPAGAAPPPPRPARLAPAVPAPGMVAKIKGRLSIVEIFKTYYPSARLKQRGRYYNCSCPFHADKNPSFYLDSQLNIFGCHACRVRGDVINLYALIKKINNEKAIEDLMIYA